MHWLIQYNPKLYSSSQQRQVELLHNNLIKVCREPRRSRKKKLGQNAIIKARISIGMACKINY